MVSKSKLLFGAAIVASSIITIISVLPNKQVILAATDNWLDAANTPTFYETKLLSPGQSPPYSYGLQPKCNNETIELLVPKESTDKTPVEKTVCTTEMLFGQVGGDTIRFTGQRFAYDFKPSTSMTPIYGTNTFFSLNGAGLFGSGTVKVQYADNINNDLRVAAVTNSNYSKVNFNGAMKTLDSGTGPMIINASSVSISNNSQWIAGSYDNGSQFLINTHTKEVKSFGNSFRYNMGWDPNIKTAVSSDGRYVAVYQGGSDRKLYMYDMDTCAMALSPSSYSCARKEMPRPHFLPGYVSSYGYSGLSFAYNNTLSLYVGHLSEDSKYVQYHQAYVFPNGDLASQYGNSLHTKRYLAMGDSFASGEGGFAYIKQTDNQDNRCHQSRSGYSELLNQQFGFAGYQTVACGGAKMKDIVYSGPKQKNKTLDVIYNEDIRQSKNKEDPSFDAEIYENYLPGYRQQINFVKKFQPNVITVSISGNDIGFSEKIIKCVALSWSCLQSQDERFALFNEIKYKQTELAGVFRNIKDQAREDANLYVLGYPRMFPDGGGSDAACSGFANVSFDQKERSTANDIVHDLNLVVKAAALSAGASYIDVENMMGQNVFCGSAKPTAFNGLTAGNDAIRGIGYPIGRESLHPSQFGYGIYTNTIKSVTNNLTIKNPEPTPQPLIKSSQSWVVKGLYGADYQVGIIPDNTKIIDQDIWSKSKNTVLTTKKLTLNMQKQQTYRVVLHSDPVDVGTATIDSDGVMTTNIAIPPDTPIGMHTLHVIADDEQGAKVDLYQDIYVAASEEDFDGNGVANKDEKCVFGEAVDQDIDNDGVDDACDGDLASQPKDTASPVVTGSIVGGSNNSGWYLDAPTISWTASDPIPSSGDPTKPADIIANIEGEHEYVSSQSCDPSGNCATGKKTVKLDHSLPIIGYVTDKTPNINGWYKSAVHIEFQCSDQVSGIASCQEPVTIFGDGEHIVSGQAIDNAGNVNDINIIVKIDSQSPGIHTQLNSQSNLAGWHNRDVTIVPSCEDSTSGIAMCSSPQILQDEGQQTIVSVARDNADNQSTIDSVVRIDKTPPLIGEPEISNNARNKEGTSLLSVDVLDQLSGLQKAEYYFGDEDPGLGKGRVANIYNDKLTVTLGSNYPPGIYSVHVRVQDNADNWSQDRVAYLIIHEDPRYRVSVHGALDNAVLSGFADAGSLTAKSSIAFMARYKKDGNLAKDSALNLVIRSGGNCQSKKKISCWRTEFRSKDMTWVTSQGSDQAIVQGNAELIESGAKIQIKYRATITKSSHRVVVAMYDKDAKIDKSSPIKTISANVHGSVIIKE